MLQLYFGDGQDEIQNPTLPVRWCVDKETLDKLESDGVKNPHILISVKGKGREMTRHLAPLGQLMEYVQFQCPGINKIHATIVWSESGKFNDLWKYYMKKGYGGKFEYWILDQEGNYDEDMLRIEKSEYEIEIPKEIFAREYPDWLKNWANLWFEGEVIDQCHFRKRCLVVFSIQPVIVLLFLVFLIGFRILAASALLLLGFKKVNLKPIIHPWDMDSNDVWWNLKLDGFWRNYIFKGDRFYLMPFTPIVPALLLAGNAVYQFETTGMVSLITAALFILKCAITYVVFAGVIALAVLGLSFAGGLLVALSKRESVANVLRSAGAKLEKYVAQPLGKLLDKIPLPEFEERKFLRNPGEVYKRMSTEQLLMCNGDKPASIDMIPPEKRTIRLKYQDFKAKVCKPLAR